MKTVLRTLLYLALIVWLGAEIFFPVVAAVTFGSLPGATHTAGSIVGELLRILHGMGIVSGLVLLALMALAPAWNIYKPHSVLAPMVLVRPDAGLHGVLAVRNHSSDGARPRCGRRSYRHCATAPTRQRCTSICCTIAANTSKRQSCCWASRRSCWWRGRSQRARRSLHGA